MVRRVKIDLGAIFDCAKLNKWIAKNVIKETPFRLSKRDNNRPEMPTVEDVSAMVAKTKEQWSDWLAFLYVAVFCGLRSSEIRGLTWANVDLRTGLVTVGKRADRWGKMGPPKSKAGTRDIPLPPIAVQSLKERKLRSSSGLNDLVFSTEKGTPINHSNIMTRYFKPLQIEAGIFEIRLVQSQRLSRRKPAKCAKFGLHALRHFCASIWIEGDYSAKKVQRLMGHASIQQTFDTYGYLFERRDHDRETLLEIQNRVLLA